MKKIWMYMKLISLNLWYYKYLYTYKISIMEWEIEKNKYGNRL